MTVGQLPDRRSTASDVPNKEEGKDNKNQSAAPPHTARTTAPAITPLFDLPESDELVVLLPLLPPVLMADEEVLLICKAAVEEEDEAASGALGLSSQIKHAPRGRSRHRRAALHGHGAAEEPVEGAAGGDGSSGGVGGG